MRLHGEPFERGGLRQRGLSLDEGHRICLCGRLMLSQTVTDGLAKLEVDALRSRVCL